MTTNNEIEITVSRYFVVPAPGHYGDRDRVYSSHSTLEAARRAAGDGYVVRVGDKRKGDRWLRADEQVYPEAKQPGRPSLGSKGRSNVLSLKVSTEERARWQEAADRQGITLGAWLREAAELAWVRGASR